MNWTKEQKAVIESRGGNLLVSAAAGSGKTAVLVERIIRMITEGDAPLDIDRLLVMTFTKAAAAEMRERIQAAIEKKLEENPENAHLQQQAVMVQYAQITTIDSFCLHVLREHFDRLDIDPSFRVGDEGEMLLLRAEVMRDLMEDSYAEDSGFKHFVDAYSSGKADGGIEDYISQVYAFAQSNPWPQEWFDRCREELACASIGEFDRTEWMQFLLRDVRMQANEWGRQLEAAAGICREEDGPAPYLPMILEDLSGVRRLETVRSYEEFSRAAGLIMFSKLAAIRGKNSPVSPEKKQTVSDCRGRVKKAVEKLKELYLFESAEAVIRDQEAGRDAVLTLLGLAEEFSRRFRLKKQEKNVVDFGDLEHFALEILMEQEEQENEEGNVSGEDDAGGAARGPGGRKQKNGETYGRTRRPSAAADELSSQYDEILVDEYQDSNLVQETLIQSLSRERFGRPNVFMVGDVKQSIYKFRLARPELFLEKYRAYPSGEEKGPCRKIELHQNFRSRDHVLYSINDIFDRIMTEKLGGIEYTEETALHPGAVFQPREQLEELCTELLLLNTAGSELESLDEDVSDYTGRELEAAAVAGKIRELVDGETGVTVWDKERECYRRAGYGDIVILLRSVSGWAESFTDVLSHQGIPAFAESRTGYFDTPEVNTVLGVLAVLDNPIQDIPLAAVLRAPFCGLTDEELARVTAACRRTAEKGRDRGLYGAVQCFLEAKRDFPGGENEILEGERGSGAVRPRESAAAEDAGARDRQLCDKLSRAMSLLEELRAAAVFLPMHELLYRIFDRTGYYDYVSATPAGETRRANLDMLVEKAAVYEATSYRGVFHFIKYIEKLRKYNTDFGEAVTVNERGDTVRIMSIHKSKGLEFPIVFLAGMGKQFNKQDARGKILIDAEFGIATDYLDSRRRVKGATLKKNVLRRRMELEALGEELRVLYVAMTRAREKLILTASSGNLDAKLEKWRTITLEDGKVPFTVLTLAGSYLDWMLMSMASGSVRVRLQTVPAGELLGREMEEQLYRRVSREELLHFDVSGIYDEPCRKLLQRSFSFVYPCAADVLLNTKMSVSELKKAGFEEAEEESAFLPTLPVFMEKEAREESGVNRGTAYHRAMELLRLDEIRSDADAGVFLEEMVRQKKMSAEAAQLVWAPDLFRFAESELGKRMARAQKEGRLYRERQFVMGIPAREMGDWDSDELVLVQGIIDAYFEEEGGLVLVDYKTDYADRADTLVKRYESQLLYYEKALARIVKKPVKEKLLYSYRLGAIRL